MQSPGRSADPGSPVIQAAVAECISRRWKNIDTIAREIDCKSFSVEEAVAELQASGYLLECRDGKVRYSKTLDLSTTLVSTRESRIVEKSRIFGLVSDNHLCNRHTRLDILNDAYDAFEKAGITTVYNCGNMVDGEARFNVYELEAHGVEGQSQFLLDNYPRRPGITTYYITGDCHEGWWASKVGLDFGQHLQWKAEKQGREDLVFLGHMEVDIEYAGKGGSDHVRLIHPGGGTAYALSYKPQKIVESLQSGEKPGMLCVGHFHKLGWFNVRNVDVILAGCTEDQTPFMRKKNIDAHEGYNIVEFWQDGNGAIRRVRVETTKYFDRAYHVVGEEIDNLLKLS
jgi:hypothetical protein